MKEQLPKSSIVTVQVKLPHRIVRIGPAIIASVVLICGMAALAIWAGARVQEGVLQRAASETVLDMDNYIKPMLQELARSDTLSGTAHEALSLMFGGTALGRDVAGIKIWSPLGTIVYSNRLELIGRSYPLSSHLRRASTGAVVVEFDDLDDDENEYERSLGGVFLEIYAPVRESGTNKIIAVAEFYERRVDLRIALQNMRWQTWAVIGSLTLAIIGIWSGVMIAYNRRELKDEVVKLRDTQHRTTEINELFLRRVSAELHDAPAQLIGLVLLRLEDLQPQPHEAVLGDERANTERRHQMEVYETIRGALVASLNDIRYISAGLVPPELTNLSLVQTLLMAASLHCERTGTAVDCDIGELPRAVDPALKISLYRFAQEGLNNAFRHAEGRGQALRGQYRNGLLEVTVSDAGSISVTNTKRAFGSGSLGLAGLRGRIEALGGVFEFMAQPGHGARLTARFNLTTLEFDYA
jgi:signal transduction histidine kinase